VGTRKETVAYILDQLTPLPVRARAMFGEYGLYCDEKMVALICDDTLFVKPTAVAPQFFDHLESAPPYPGAKDWHVVSGDRMEHREWLQALIARTAEALPAATKRPRTTSGRRNPSRSSRQ
jgi:TfoX/Sxy family transcriptional regulator of competence genes